MDLKDYRGKAVVILFWSSMAKTGSKTIASLQRTEELLGSDRLAVIGVSLDKKKDEMDAFIDKHGMKWPVHFDGKGWKNSVAVQFGVSKMPWTIIVDKNGVVREMGLLGGKMTAAIRKAIDD